MERPGNMTFIVRDASRRDRATSTVSRLTTAALMGLLLGVVPLVARPAPAGAYPTATVVVRGHGWGHGRGMGQYGAIGYATSYGWSAAQILDHFYGGTRAGTVAEDRPANPPFSVELFKERGEWPWVTAANGIDVTLPGGAVRSANAWYAVPALGGAWDLYAGTTCAGAAGGWPNLANRVATVTGQVRFAPRVDTTVPSAPKEAMTQTCRTGVHYRGDLRAVEFNGGPDTINVLPLESYLWGSVPRELSASSPVEALKAQAVAARSYALSRTLNSTFAGCDTACGLYQAYEGADVEAAASTGAIMATSGVVRRMNATGRIAPTEYSSSTGGWTVGGTFPAVEDLGDVASPRHEWNASVPVSAVEARYARGTLQSITVDQRDGIGDMGGRVIAMTLRFSGGTATISGDDFKNAFMAQGVFSRWFEIQGGPVQTPAFTPLTPSRMLDTRSAGATLDGLGGSPGALGPGATRTLQVTGRGGVPASGVGAVVLNITATSPTAGGFLTVHPTGAARPNASNLNFGPSQTIPNLVVAKVGTGGQVSIYNDSGATHLIADVAGWFSAGPGYAALDPGRLLDTRPGASTVDGASAGGGSIAPGATRTLQVTGRGGVPSSGVGAVVLNITATGPTAGGFLTVHPTGAARPNASNLNFGPSQTIPNLVVAKVGTGGQVSIYNDSGSTQVLADVAGWFPTTSPFASMSPVRLLDSRAGATTIDGTAAAGGAVGPGATLPLQVTGRGGVPANGVGAVVLNITATSPTAGGYLTVHPTGQLRPNASNLNFGPGQTIPNLVIAKVGTNGQVSIYNDSGSTQIIADVAGWFPG